MYIKLFLFILVVLFCNWSTHCTFKMYLWSLQSSFMWAIATTSGCHIWPVRDVPVVFELLTLYAIVPIKIEVAK